MVVRNTSTKKDQIQLKPLFVLDSFPPIYFMIENYKRTRSHPGKRAGTNCGLGVVCSCVLTDCGAGAGAGAGAGVAALSAEAAPVGAVVGLRHGAGPPGARRQLAVAVTVVIRPPARREAW